MDRSRTLEIRYSFWRLVRYLAVSAGALLLSWHAMEYPHWTIAILGIVGLPLAGISLADAIWRFYAAARGPDITLSMDGIDTYGVRIPWSAIHYTSAKRAFGLSTIELHFYPGDADHLEFDFAGRLARWAMTAAEQDGLLLSAFALRIEHDELAALIEAFRAETHRTAVGRAGSSPLDAPAPDA